MNVRSIVDRMTELLLTLGFSNSNVYMVVNQDDLEKGIKAAKEGEVWIPIRGVNYTIMSDSDGDTLVMFLESPGTKRESPLTRGEGVTT